MYFFLTVRKATSFKGLKERYTLSLSSWKQEQNKIVLIMLLEELLTNIISIIKKAGGITSFQADVFVLKREAQVSAIMGALWC